MVIDGCRYCRIHNTISIGLLAEKLDMDRDHAEEWVVALIRDARLDAKIDSKAGHVLMTPQVCDATQPPPAHLTAPLFISLL